MFYSYLKYAWRTLSKNKSGTILNILGLTIGIASCLLIFQYVEFEKSYDRFIPDVDKIYRVNLGMTNSESAELEFRATNHPATGIYLQNDIPGIRAMTRLVDVALLNGSSVLSYENSNGQKSFYEKNLFYADSSFFSVFNLQLLQGDKTTALGNQQNIVLTESTARKCFGSSNPMGETIIFNGSENYTVAGIMQDPPANSHLEINALLSASGFSPGLNNTWIWPEFYTYIKLDRNADADQVSSQLDAFVDRYLGEVMSNFGIVEKMTLQPVSDIHLSGNVLKEVKANNTRKTLTFLSIIAIMILLIAWINYINLSVSKSIEREKEIGIKKVIGASKKSIIIQFLTEATLVNIIAIVMAVAMATSLGPYFVNLTQGSSTAGSITEYTFEKQFLFKVLVILIGGILVVGIYPAIKLATFKPLGLINNKLKFSQKSFSLQNVLVVFQFCTTLLMLSGTLVIYHQLKYMQSKNLGFNAEELLVMKAPSITDSTRNQRFAVFKERLLQNTNIRNIAISSDIPGHLIQNNNSIRRSEQLEAESIFATYLATDPHYIPTYELNLLSGRNFRRDQTADENAVILNNKAVQMLGFRSPEEIVGKNIKVKINLEWQDLPVIGIVQDFNHRSLEFPMEPFVLFNREHVPYDYYTLDISTSDLSTTMAFVEKEYLEIFPKNPFDYFFLDSYFQSQYNSKQRLAKLIGLFTILAILVSCLGLIGLVTHISLRKAKEAGIRKVLGANTRDIILIFTKRFLILIFISSLIAVPLTYWGGNSWLNNFAFRTSLGYSVFILPLLSLASLSFLIILWQSSKVIWIDPAKILRDE